ncbi:hypothetical protein WA026_015011 [Henosepilachna vigintioctopunctata]|uniref:Uncharacterized protein n=1 Tax=Henosepilachna vigintioctopunctata TaxID=420089 RepID=A0AAW1U7Z2_9CUCU
MICKGCKIYMSIIEIDNQRFYWTEQLSKTNSELHKKIIYLSSYISILEKKIANLNEIILLKDVAYASNRLEKEEENIEKLSQCKNKKETHNTANNILKKFRDAFSQLNRCLQEFQLEKNKFEKILTRQQEEFIENTDMLHEMISTYRENLFKEMKKYNDFKLWIHDELQIVKKQADDYIKTNVESMKKSLDNSIKSKYKSTIEHYMERIKQQDELIKKMQVHRRELYNLLRKEKFKQNHLKEIYEKSISDLQMQIRKLTQKNQDMETLIRLQ